MKNRTLIRAAVSTLAMVVLTWPGALPEARAADDDRPAYHVLRQNEDWSFLADHEGETDLFDPIKYIPLTDDGQLWMSLGGQIRERLEGWNDNVFGQPAGSDPDDVLLLSRFLFHGDVHMTDMFRVFVQGKSSLSTRTNLDARNRKLDRDQIDLQNAFGEIAVPIDDVHVRLRGGREELLFGKQRLVSPLDWANTRRTFDGVNARVKAGRWSTTGFWTKPVQVKKNSFNKNGNDFYGLYATATDLVGLDGLDLYWLDLDRGQRTFNGTTGSETRHTLGVRAWGGVRDTSVYYDGEFAYQFGDVGSADVNAFMITGLVGTKLDFGWLTPKVEAGFGYASGDDNPGDNDVETFNQLFPLGHAYLGYIDVVGRQNIIDMRLSSFFDVFFDIGGKLDFHYFWRADDDDALYNAGGGVVRAGNLGSSNDVGAELDLTFKRALTKHLKAIFGYSHFFAGDFIEQSGPDDDIDFVHVTLQLTI